MYTTSASRETRSSLSCFAVRSASNAAEDEHTASFLDRLEFGCRADLENQSVALASVQGALYVTFAHAPITS